MKAVELRGDAVLILDQTRLPLEEAHLEARSAEEVAEAIRSLAVRGAPLIGIAAGYALAVEAARSTAPDAPSLLREIERAAEALAETRPTAVNLRWAIDRVLEVARAAVGMGVPFAPVGDGGDARDAVRRAVLEEARTIASEDEWCCEAIGKLGEALVPAGARVLTHCNTGSLATGGIGTAQGIIVAAHRSGKGIHVWVDETRPLLQGARLTSWELARLGVPMTLVADAAAGSLMARGVVDLVVVGADRIAANGDVANKVGTYQLAVLARHHRIPFVVAAPTSTVDPGTPTGEEIVVEERGAEEVVSPRGVAFASPDTPAANPAFDVTPARLVTALVTERGIARPPYRSSLRRLLHRQAGRSARPREGSGADELREGVAG